MRKAPLVLVAEDSLVVRAVLSDHLQAQGYEVVEAADGQQAVEECRNHRPDAVLLDVEMPILDGYQVLALLKTDAELRDIPVVFLTGRAETEDVVVGLRLGAHDYLRKPFEPAELIGRVSAALRTKALQDELRRRNEELDRLTRTDALTGLFNRRHLEEQLRASCNAAARHGHRIAALILDIDEFKRVNDTYGHAAGDAVLTLVADRLKANVRADEVLGRWGGEEFLVIIPIGDLKGSVVLAERLRSGVGDSPLELEDSSRLNVTISVGCADSDGGDPDSLLSRADAALYEAKESGRNRVATDPSAPSSAS